MHADLIDRCRDQILQLHLDIVRVENGVIGDIAQTLGGVLREELDVGSEVLAVDGIVLVDFDYIDLGRIRLPSHTVPVTVKSLVF